MTPMFPELPHRLGNYTLTRLLQSGEETELYEAAQARVERAVILELLRPGQDSEREAAFLNKARLRAAAEGLPHVGRVVETLRADGIWFMAQERPSGYALAELQSLGHMLTAPQVCRIIEAVAAMYSICRESGLTAGPLSACSIFLNASNTVSMLSPLENGAESTENDVAQRLALAEAIMPMRPIGVDGEQRVLTLLQWLSSGYEDGSPVDWNTFIDTCSRIRIQMGDSAAAEPPPVAQVSEARTRRRRSRTRRTLLRGMGIGAAALLFIGSMVYVGSLFPMGAAPTLPAAHNGVLSCQQNGIPRQISLHPVSIAEYEQFLLALEEMSSEDIQQINRDIPEQYRDHLPAEWQQLSDAARNRKEYAGRTLSPQSPMVHVNYWDALAYARYKGNGSRLPEAAVLQAAVPYCEDTAPWEWTVTASGAHPLELHEADFPLVIDMAAPEQPIPGISPETRSANLGFRLSASAAKKINPQQ